MDFSDPFLICNKLLRSASRRERQGLILQMLSVSEDYLGISPSGKDGASWVSGLSRAHCSTPTQASVQNLLWIGALETLLPWRTTYLAKREGMQSALVYLS